MNSEKYSLEQTATTAFTRQQFQNEKEVNLHTIHKPEKPKLKGDQNCY